MARTDDFTAGRGALELMSRIVAQKAALAQQNAANISNGINNAYAIFSDFNKQNQARQSEFEKMAQANAQFEASLGLKGRELAENIKLANEKTALEKEKLAEQKRLNDQSIAASRADSAYKNAQTAHQNMLTSGQSAFLQDLVRAKNAQSTQQNTAPSMSPGILSLWAYAKSPAAKAGEYGVDLSKIDLKPKPAAKTPDPALLSILE